MSDTDMAYLAHCEAGHFMGVCVDNPSHRKDTSNIVASWVKRGFVLQRLTVGAAREQINFDTQADHERDCLGRATKPKAPKQEALL